MISCLELYRISAQISKALGISDRAFRGLNVILAGDFAQLPPAGRHAASLYSNSIRLWSNATSLVAQQSAIGKALWHQFITVIILQKNMHQQGMTNEDVHFRTVLQNMRCQSCTPEDITLLCSQVITTASHPLSDCFADCRFQDVTTITAFNMHRDAINEVCTKHFAANHHVNLTHFHSIDTWSSSHELDSVRSTQCTQDSTWNPQRSSDNIVTGIQNILWSLPPALSGHCAGILSLCPEMPVMLKNKEATELCATNSTKEYVYGWDSHNNEFGHEILDTLFVRLKSPPLPMQIEGLPPNVIAIPRSKTHVKCVLQNDTVVNIDREQANVLPDFAMTDFGAQGCTRPFNVAHLKHCKGHQSMYTCLSCSSSLFGTLILDGFDAFKLTGSMSGDLCCEFHELEILDDIHHLRFSSELPSTIHGCTRVSLITTCQSVFGAQHVPPNMKSILDWGHSPATSLLPPAEPSLWQLLEKHRRGHVPSTIIFSAQSETAASASDTLLARGVK
ncbi:uncharacterized protein LAESUDRAFT_656800 [Laetiporus sulphureus 93-53]|uniref:DNA helicase n=1 Tax=Laetiporus sulphureus 93-53 TaxID=1314785 RepID=A0A165DJB7_9APHY|nr:uncharacterized protein LAESUDRAFT_656800 [Laetiporus sulphureus 93-53]KZT05008.1 hypothetical protein LAESUDRAFT_656800 [Laetiporus sulphureus 93-53]